MNQWEIGELLEKIDDEINWMKAHEEEYKDALQVKRSSEYDHIDKMYANTVISEYNKAICRVSTWISKLNKETLSESRAELLNEFSSFISYQKQLRNGQKQ